MENEIYVSCHAPSLSLLLYETVRSDHDQKGLLIGEICNEIISEKTDENEMNKEQRTTIYLEHCIPIKDQDFFGNVGNINKQKLHKYLDRYFNKVVGWYSFRRNTQITLRTLREILIHQSLIEMIPYAKAQYFIAAFMSASVAANFSTHTFNHVFMRFHPARASFEPLRFKIYTMSDKIISSISGNTFPTSKTFDKTINTTKKDNNPITSILTINKTINESLKSINRKLQEVERDRNNLEQQIKDLRRLLSLNNIEGVMVKETEKEKDILEVQYLHFNSEINYGPLRKENPIKAVQANATPLVPEELSELRFLKNQREFTNSPGSNKTVSGKSSRSRQKVTSVSSERNNSFLNQCQDVQNSLMQISGDEKSNTTKKNSGSSSGENTKILETSEGNKITGSV